MAEVFISYKSDRRNAAKHLAGILTRYGYSVWFDYGLIKGDDFEFQLDQQLRAAKAVVVLWCSMSVESRWVSREASLASNRGTFIPVLIEPCELKLAYHSSDYVDLSGWDGSPRSHLLIPLLREVARLVGRAPQEDWANLTEYEEHWRMFGSPTLAAFALGKPIESSVPNASERLMTMAAHEWPAARESRDIETLRSFELHFAGTYFADQARVLRRMIENQQTAVARADRQSQSADSPSEPAKSGEMPASANVNQQGQLANKAGETISPLERASQPQLTDFPGDAGRPVAPAEPAAGSLRSPPPASFWQRRRHQIRRFAMICGALTAISWAGFLGLGIWEISSNRPSPAPTAGSLPSPAGTAGSLHFAYDINLPITFKGPPGGPFQPEVFSVLLTATGGEVRWTAESNSPAWLDISPSAGTIPAGQNLPVRLRTSEGAKVRSSGPVYKATVWFHGNNGNTLEKTVQLIVGDVSR